MIGSKLVEKTPLHVRAGQAVQFLLLLVAQQALQLLEVVEAELLANSSSNLVSAAVFTAVTLTSNVAGFPFKFSA